MWPITEPRLSLHKIADYWSREISPPASWQELMGELIKAFWRGQLQLTGIADRLRLLQGLHRDFQQQIAFAVPDHPEPAQFEHLADGGALLIRPVRVPVPSEASSNWSEGGCTDAFEALANEWEVMPDNIRERFLPAFAGAELAREQFAEWVRRRDSTAPQFWGMPGSGAGSPGDARSSSSHDVVLAASTRASASAVREEAILALMHEGHDPGNTIPWKRFCDRLRNACGARPSQRGFADRSIQRAVERLKSAPRTPRATR